MRGLREGLRALACAWVLSACLGPDDAVPPGRDRVRVQTIGAPENVVQTVSRAVPTNLRPQERALFKRRDAAGAVWSSSPMNAFDLTGIAWGGGRAVLITDRHALGAAHTPKPARGTELTFYDQGGWPVTRTAIGVVTLPRLRGADLDTRVVRLDEPVPAGVTVYPLAAGDAATLAAARTPVITTFARGGRTARGETGWGAFATIATLSRVTSGGARLAYDVRADLFAPGSQAGHAAMWGDSGSPSFLATGDGLALLSHTHTSGGAGRGPNYADPEVQRLIREAVATLNAASGGAPGENR